MNREELVEQLIAIREQEKEITKQLNVFDYEEKLNDAKKYEGKYFREVNERHKEHVRCLFVYSIDKERCEPMVLRLGYWEGIETSHFNIEYYGYFNPKKWDDDIEEWFEITKDEYMQHYAEVQKRISLAASAKKT